MSKNNKEKQNGSNANDSLVGGSANEKVDGKSGDDIVAGGSGEDWVKGGSGDDKLTYVVGLNADVSDFYDGGSGTNILELQMTKSEWMRDDVRADIAAYLAFLDSDQPSAQGQNNSKGFEFASLGLTARRLHSLEILVNGIAQDPADQEVVANDDAHTSLGEHSLVFGNVTDNDDVPDLVREVTLVTAPAQGILTLDADGSFSYDPGDEFDYLAAGESAQVEFSYRVTDADRDSDTAVVLISVTGTNDKPIAEIDYGTIDENAPLLVDVLANDTDVDASDSHTVTAASIASGLGAVAIVGNQVQWTPGTDYDYLALGESATVAINYTMADNNGAESSSLLTLTVTGSNDGPLANVDTASTDENATLLVDVLANDTDIDASDTKSVISATIASGLGSVAIANNQIEWTPGTEYDYLALGESATVTIGYTIADNNGAESSSVLTLSVIGSNDGPLANADSAVAVENETLIVDVLANDTDVDDADTLSIESITSALNGTAVIDANTNTVLYTPNADFFGDDSFSYTTTDAAGASSTALVSITVNRAAETLTVSNLITNGSFESGSAGWSFYYNSAVRTNYDAADGHRVVELEQGIFSSDPYVRQSINTIPGEQYTVGYSIAADSGHRAYVIASINGFTADSARFSKPNSYNNLMWDNHSFTFTASGSTTSLQFKDDSYSSFFYQDVTYLDEIVVLRNESIDWFDKSLGDKLDLNGLLSSIHAPHDSTAFSDGFLNFLASDNDTIIQIDPDGGGDDYLNSVTLVGVSLTAADTDNYIL